MATNWENSIFFQLSKQQLMYGPMQIESRIDQDQNISKDLTLWNQQGSRVLRGNIIALPVSGGFLYVESIYIQATEARMPQLKKVVLAMGNRLIYRDTFDEALAELTGTPAPQHCSSRNTNLRGQRRRTHRRWPSTSVIFGIKPSNWRKSWRSWKRKRSRSRFWIVSWAFPTFNLLNRRVAV